MGLDSVELVMAIEEEFGVDIPDRDAENMITVGLTFEWLKARLAATEPIACLTQRIFYKLRRALVDNYGLNRIAIKPDTRLTDVLSLADVAAGWPFLQMFIDLETPSFKAADEFFGFRLSERSLTMRELVDSLIRLNSKKLTPQVDTESEVWNRLVKVILRQLNVNIEDVVPEASYVRDLGVD